MAGLAPRARVLDVSHAVAAQDVRQGALVLEQAVPYLPRAALAVVDPGSGAGRGWWRSKPGAGAGRAGQRPAGVGGRGAGRGGAGPRPPTRPTGDSVLADLPRARRSPRPPTWPPGSTWPSWARSTGRAGPAGAGGAAVVAWAGSAARVVAVDHFGNLALDLRRWTAWLVAAGDPVEVRVGGRAHQAVQAETFASVPAGDLLLHEDSFGSLAAVNRGRAAERLGAGPRRPGRGGHGAGGDG